MGTDEDVERAARVSYGYGTRKTSQTRGLIRYLRRHYHTTPSEMVELKFHCAMPMFVARQWIRHRTASVNEYSGRYSLMPLLFYKPDLENFSLQNKDNAQGRQADSASQKLYEKAVEHWEQTREEISRGYQWMVEEDVARELARIDLPLSTYTQWYWKIDLHNLFHFLTLRDHPHAQWEIQAFARVMAGMLKRVAPLSYEAWIDYNVCGQAFSRSDILVLNQLLDAGEHGIKAKNMEGTLDRGALQEFGLSAREIRELMTKLEPVGRPDHALDLSIMRKAEDVGRELEAAVPGSSDSE
mgnify:CR=1 FL=1